MITQAPHTSKNTKPINSEKKIITINGDNFYERNGFYNELKSVMAANVEWNIDKDLHALNDLLRGGFGAHAYEEPIKLVWLNSAKSKIDLDFPAAITQTTELGFGEQKKAESLFDVLVNIIKIHPHIELVLA